METIILGQLWMKASEEVIALSKSNDRPRGQRVDKAPIFWSWMLCVWQ